MKGFVICLNLPARYHQGLEAIDLCRKFGLEDDHSFYTRGEVRRGDLPETFVRAWFGPTSTFEEVDISLDWLVPGELTRCDGAIRPNGETIPPERAMKLFVKGKFAESQSD
jgi:hypothetical protein